MPLREQQRELVHFLLGGEQIAFHPLGKQGDGGGFGFQAVLLQAGVNPRGQSIAADGFGFQHRAVFAERGKPFGLRLRAFQLGQHN